MDTNVTTIRRTHTDSVFSTDKAFDLDVELRGKSRRVHYTTLTEDINQYEQYLREKSESDRYRLICNIRPYCSNALFNPFTEVVKLVNDKKYEIYTGNAVTRDTSGSSEANVTYMPGFDIFNNHLLRAKKDVIIYGANHIESEVKDAYGKVVTSYFRESVSKLIGDAPQNVHVYTTEDLLHFYDADKGSYECAEAKLLEDDGWFGFSNVSTLKTGKRKEIGRKFFTRENTKLLGGENECSFVDMYPDRTLFSFVPKYNALLGREERNWDILLTYPSQTCFIENVTTGGYLPIMGRRQEVDASGKNVWYFCTEVRHNLNKGDTLMFYNYATTNPTTGQNGAYISIGEGDVEFTVLNTGDWNGNHEEYFFSIGIPELDGFREIDKYNAFRRIDNGNECIYYVRLLEKIGDIRKQDYRLAFSKNAYGDDLTQIVFTDDIDVSDKTDNLGRPVSEMFVTILKRNAGHNEWYGESSENAGEADSPTEPAEEITDGDPTDSTNDTPNEEPTPEEGAQQPSVALPPPTFTCDVDNVEYSHCFTDLVCGVDGILFENEEYTDKSTRKTFFDCRFITTNNKMKAVWGDDSNNDYMECVLTTDSPFFPCDVVEFSPYTGEETKLADIHYRFNTFQRENVKKVSPKGTLTYDELERDDYDGGFSCKQYDIKAENKYEGYHYQPNYRIRLKQLGEPVYKSRRVLSIVTAEPFVDGGMKLSVRTLHDHKLNTGDVVRLFDNSYTDGDKYIDFTVTSIVNRARFTMYPKGGEWKWNAAQDNQYNTDAVTLATTLSTTKESLMNDLVDIITENVDITAESGVKTRYNLIEAVRSGDYQSSYFEGFKNSISGDAKKQTFEEKLDLLKLRTYLALYVMDGSIPEYARRIAENTYVWRDVYPGGDIMATELPDRTFANGATYITEDINFYLHRQDPFGTNGLNTTDDPIPNVMGEILEDSAEEYKEDITETC